MSLDCRPLAERDASRRRPSPGQPAAGTSGLRALAAPSRHCEVAKGDYEISWKGERATDNHRRCRPRSTQSRASKTAAQHRPRSSLTRGQVREKKHGKKSPCASLAAKLVGFARESDQNEHGTSRQLSCDPLFCILVVSSSNAAEHACFPLTSYAMPCRFLFLVACALSVII